MSGPFRVGGDTPAHCSHCRDERDHVIVAMVNGRPIKVECQSCHRQHRYRTGTAPASTVARSRRAVEPSPAPDPAPDLYALLYGKAPIDYHPDTRFSLGDAVRHPSFGVGAVTGLPGFQKVEVFFSKGVRVLTHDRTAAPSLTRPTPIAPDGVPHVTDAPNRKR